MEICRFLRTTLILLFLFLPFQSIAENQLIKTKINALDFTLLKYELFLNKNLQRLFGGGGLVNPIISYEHVDYNVKYKEDNYFLIEIYAYMNKHRYTNKVKYTPKNKDCNTVRNKIFLNKIGYYFLSKKNKKTFNQEDLKIQSVPVKHGNINSICYIINNKCAYASDVSKIYNKDMKKFLNLKYLVIDY